MINVFGKQLDAAKILALRSSQYVQALYVEDTVPPGPAVNTPLGLSTIGAFLVLSFTGFFTCLRQKVIGVSLEDLGVCPFRMILKAGASNLDMFGNYVPMDLLLTPGRRRTDPADAICGGLPLAAADQGPAPNPLFFPFEYLFPFEANDIINVTVQNDYTLAAGGWTNRWGICFKGIRARYLNAALKETGKKPLPKKP